MVFENRFEAGELLAKRLYEFAKRNDVVVLGIPRGGVQVAYMIAKELAAPLDVLVLRKLGVPGHEELAFGAVARDHIRILNSEIISAMNVTNADIERVAALEQAEVERREGAYRGGQPPLAVQAKTVILVDDGIATGSSIRAAIEALRKMEPARIVLAVPVAPLMICRRLESEVDVFVCAYTPRVFHAIGEFYEDFSQVSDLEVIELLGHSTRPVAHRVLSHAGHA